MPETIEYESVLFEVDDNVATITLNRPQALNAFTRSSLPDFVEIWGRVRDDNDIHVAVLRAAGDRAFCSGADAMQGEPVKPNVWTHRDPGDYLGPKRNTVWKPVICAVQGIAAGGAFYFLNEADIIICSADAMFFDPHVTYGRTAAVEPIGLRYRAPLGEVLRMALLGLDERMSAERALQIGLVSEIVGRADLWPRAEELARIIATKPTVAIQGTVKAIWESMDMTRNQAITMGTYYPVTSKSVQPPIDITTIPRPNWRLR